MRNFTLFLLLMFSVSLTAQITITYSDFQKVWSVGSYARSFSTPTGEQQTVFIGTASSTAQSWDFSGLNFVLAGTSRGVTPSSAPFAAQFPEANAVLYGELFVAGLTDTIKSWQFQRLDADKLSLYGLSTDSGILFSYPTPVVQAKIPMAMGVTWSTRDCTVYMPSYYFITESTKTVDAFGTMNLASGNYNCLRVMHDNFGTLYTPAGSSTSRSRSFHFFNDDFVEVNVMNVDEAQFGLTTVTVSGINYSVLDKTGAVAELRHASTCTLYPCSPNPFRSITSIKYDLTATEQVSLKVIDFLGKEILTLVDQEQTAGTHEVFFEAGTLPEGVYLCRLNAGKSSQVSKMVITR